MHTFLMSSTHQQEIASLDAKVGTKLIVLVETGGEIRVIWHLLFI